MRRADESDEVAEVVAVAADEFRARQARGEDPDPEEYAARHPAAAEILRRILGRFRLTRPPAEAGGEPAPVGWGRLGDFRIVREVGRGGMGVVYEAEQVSLGRRVALKVLPFAATADPRHVQRFQHEARAAALLHHEHIVPVYAVGSDRGVYYYAMQFVDGRTAADLIAEVYGPAATRVAPAASPADPAAATATHAAAITPAPAAPTPPAAITRTGPRPPDFFRVAAALCADAADALEHAHALGIVHRDVKPGNLLLDGGGKVWVADFGLAQVASDPGLTHTGDVVGTPRYMSPEQAQTRHNLVDHRTDVYSLGATLYELLTGRPAFDGRDRAEVLRRLAADEPVPPRRLDRKVPADLETVCLTCLAKDPAERYQSAGELAGDLRRYLADRPITARPPTARQRAARWARRHPRPVAVVVLTLLLAAAGGVAWDRQRVAQRLATMEAEAAARHVAGEADELFRQGRYPEAQANARRAVDLLPRGGDGELRQNVTRLASNVELANKLEEARLEGAVRTSLDGREGFDRRAALPHYRQAFLDYGVDVLGGDEGAAADLLRRSVVRAEIVAALDDWSQLAADPGERARLGRLAEAVGGDGRGWLARARRAWAVKDTKALDELAAAATADLPPPAVVTLLAGYLTRAGAVEDAERLLRAGAFRYPGDFWVNLTLGDFLATSGSQADRAEAVEYTRAALSLRPHSPGVWANLGAVLGNGEKWPEAEAASRRAIELAPGLAQAHSNLANALGQQGRFPEAEAAARRAIEVVPDLASAHCCFGIARFRLGDLAGAKAAYQRALELRPDMVEAHNGLGVLLERQGNSEAAEATLRRAIKLRPDFAAAHNSLGEVLLNRGKLPEAEAAFRRAIQLDPLRAGLHSNLGNVLQSRGALAEAEAAHRQAVRLAPGDFMAHYNLGGVLRERGRLPEAEAAYRRSIALKSDYAEAHCNLGAILELLGRFDESLEALRRGHELGTQRQGWPYPSADWVRRAERFATLDGKLSAVLAGAAEPADATERVALAEFGLKQKKLPAAAVRLYEDAFAARPRLADGVNGHRYNAACAAARAAAGAGEDAAPLPDAERSRLRRRSLDWLTAEYAAYANLARTAVFGPRVRAGLEHWHRDPDLVSVRDPSALAKLSAGERAGWGKLWADAAALLASITPEVLPPPRPA